MAHPHATHPAGRRVLCTCGHFRAHHGFNRPDGACTQCGYGACNAFRRRHSHRRLELHAYGWSTLAGALPIIALISTIAALRDRAWYAAWLPGLVAYLAYRPMHDRAVFAWSTLRGYRERREPLDTGGARMAEVLRHRPHRVAHHPAGCACAECVEVRLAMRNINTELTELLKPGDQR